ncbi:TPA: hypothetical protein ACIU15_003966 [Yersinia enterocolitica]|uniref:hypothetical protein n=1 Tax=Yersinia enterocolitica TaxID=630 RepID=UPI002A7D60F7|nr:hypothetical protein [Yersinia enterocolitica]HDL7967973.1 hypothetical protein [Yersinia enterocolitica]
MELKYGTAMFIADEPDNIKVWLQHREGIYFVRWNDEPEIEITEDYLISLEPEDVFYISQLTLMIDELDNPELED